MKTKSFVLLSLILLSFFVTSCENKQTEKNQQYIISTPKQMNLNGSDISYENAMLFIDESERVCFLDYETMQSSVACNRPNCTHSYECPSKQFAKSNPPPVVYKDNVYYFTSNCDFVDSEDGTQKEAEIESKLMKYSLKTGETETFTTIAGSDAADYSNIYLRNNMLYFITSIGVIRNENGTLIYNTKSGEQFLYSVNLDTAEAKNYGRINTHENAFNGIISEGNFSAAMFNGVSIAGIYNDDLYLYYCFPTNPDEIKEILMQGSLDVEDCEWEFIVVSFDFETGEFSNIDLQRPFCISEDYYLYYDKDKYVALDKDLNKIEIDCFSQPYKSEKLGNALMSILDAKVWRFSEDDMCFDLETKQKYKLSRTNIEQVLAEKDGEYLVLYYQDDIRHFEWINKSDLLGR